MFELFVKGSYGLSVYLLSALTVVSIDIIYFKLLLCKNAMVLYMCNGHGDQKITQRTHNNI